MKALDMQQLYQNRYRSIGGKNRVPILMNSSSRLLFQGDISESDSFYLQQMITYRTKLVGGVGVQDKKSLDLPVFDSVRDAVRFASSFLTGSSNRGVLLVGEMDIKKYATKPIAAYITGIAPAFQLPSLKASKNELLLNTGV
ncbi:hypothetical protein ACTFIW_012086 [Dictyostelium discoideum]